MTRRLTAAVLCEASADFRLAKCLVERCFEITGLAHSDIEFIDFTAHAKFCTFRDVGLFFKAHHKTTNPNSFLRSRFKGIPDTSGDRGPVMKFSELPSVARADILIITRDIDSRPERRSDIESIVEFLQDRAKLVAWGVADRCRESWVLSGFVPDAEHEKTAYQAWRKQLSFDPLEAPEKLQGDHHPRSAKAGLKKLTNGSPQREEQCWESTPLEHLQSHGEGNGLASFLKRLQDVVEQVTSRDNSR